MGYREYNLLKTMFYVALAIIFVPILLGIVTLVPTTVDNTAVRINDTTIQENKISDTCESDIEYYEMQLRNAPSIYEGEMLKQKQGEYNRLLADTYEGCAAPVTVNTVGIEVE